MPFAAVLSAGLGTRRLSRDVRIHGEYWGVSGLCVGVFNTAACDYPDIRPPAEQIYGISLFQAHSPLMFASRIMLPNSLYCLLRSAAKSPPHIPTG
jgi:hypothetical protein